MLKTGALLVSLLLCVPPASAQFVAQTAGRAAQSAPRVPLGNLGFSHTPESLSGLGAEKAALLTRSLDAVAALPKAQRSFAATALAIERAYAEYHEAVQPAVFLASVSPDPAVRAAAEALDKETDRLMVYLGQREDLYEAVRDAAALSEDLAPEDRRLLEKSLSGFKHAGLGLDAAARERLGAAERRLSELGQAFSRNLRDADLTLDVSESRLAGLPRAAVEALPRLGDGRRRLRLDAPTYGLVMERAEDRKLRRAAYFKHGNAAAVENAPVLAEALALRHETARLLGYRNYATMALAGRMAKTPRRVWEFLNRLRASLRGRADAERETLRSYAREHGTAGAMRPWDAGWWEARLKRERLGYDPEEARQYFPMDSVLDKAFRVYERLLGVRFVEADAGEAWHPEVRLVEVHDAASGARLGRFYLDLFPREGKYGHMAAFTLVKGRALPDGTYREPLSALVGNFTRPGGGRPSLLRPGEVKTLFHELGHIMHQLLTTAPHWSQSGSATARDFVEAPSQMMENFVWNADMLVRLSSRWDAPGESLPAATAERIVADKFFSPASDALGQAVLAAFDLAVHSTGHADALAVYARVVKAFLGKKPARGTNFPARFGHIMGGYAAGYYGYLWSRVFAQDVFSVFERAGIVSPETGRRWREAVLERGSSRDEADSLRDFLGREPSEDAFLRWLSPSA
ncbi:MAG: Zn-dependent oligopeptidase [Elusimicrobia bacterium]|nr:Zn-dependent oligopeptidase [Elusimicrobiota bacterium]